MSNDLLLTRLGAIVGERGLLTDATDIEPYLVDWRRLYHGAVVAVVRPASTQEVADVVALCAEAKIAIVPQGGNTGMSGAATPDTSGHSIVLSLGRMNRIRDVDALNNTLTVEAGCILANIQQAAAQVDRLFPLSLGSEGSCQIGGNLSTNAGGINVLRYGNARDLVLGLEVVLPDGRILNGLRRLRKDNTGYDLKQLFLGAEGTLGVITAAVLKLFPRPTNTVTAFAAVASPQVAVELLALLRQYSSDTVSTFELISRNCLDLVLKRIPGTRDPLPQPYSWYVLTELGDMRTSGGLRAESEAAFSAAVEKQLVSDVVIAQSQAQAQALWRLRETIPDAARDEGLIYRHDIAVDVSRVPDFITQSSKKLEHRFPSVRIICFGHLGDGNLHFNVLIPGRDAKDEKARSATDVHEVVYNVVHEFHGSVSGEHGIGQSKRGELVRYKSAVELDVMRTLKKALDPYNLMNPGKIL